MLLNNKNKLCTDWQNQWWFVMTIQVKQRKHICLQYIYRSINAQKNIWKSEKVWDWGVVLKEDLMKFEWWKNQIP